MVRSSIKLKPSEAIQDILIEECKVSSCETVSKQVSVSEISNIMASKNTKQVIVLDQQKPVGIITLTDVVYKAVAPKKDLSKTTAWEICTRDVFYLEETEPAVKAYLYMIANNRLFCPVVSKEKFKGVIHLGSITRKMRENGSNKTKK